MAAHLLKFAHNSKLQTTSHGSLLPELHLSWGTDRDYTYLVVTDGYIISSLFPHAHRHIYVKAVGSSPVGPVWAS